MVLELKYRRPSQVQRVEQVFLEPELSQHRFCFQAEIADSRLMAEVFYRLHCVSAVKAGRLPQELKQVKESTRWMTSHRWFYYDPLITVADGFVDYECFSLDMHYYAKARFSEEAFKNVEHWEKGVTNVDFSKSFIQQVRKANKTLKNVLIDPEGIEVQSDREAMLEKKIPLPENWKAGLDSLRGTLKEPAADLVIPKANYNAVLAGVNFLPQTFLKSFAKVQQIWTHPTGLQIIEFNLRGNQGTLLIGVTQDKVSRFDGRKNIDFKKVEQLGWLPKVQAYFLNVTQVTPGQYEVKGDSEPHPVTLRENQLVCDCRDFVFNKNQLCKHVQAVNLPAFEVTPVNTSLWSVSSPDQEFAVELTPGGYSCECKEAREVNICIHIVAVMRYRNDYQFNEIKDDFAPPKNVLDADTDAIEVDARITLQSITDSVAWAIFSNQQGARIGSKTFPIKKTVSKSGTTLRYVDFLVEGVPFRVIEQDIATNSRWAQMAKQGSEIVWVSMNGEYHANWVDGDFRILRRKK